LSISDYFKAVPTMNAAQVREILSRKEPSEYNLIDVRQPGEYERAHLPGARLMPVADLLSLAGGLDPNIPTIAY
jgi:sulfur-carrier protein adenylyltransferase/sulfurtransferase